MKRSATDEDGLERVRGRRGQAPSAWGTTTTALAIALLASGCPRPYDPFRIPRDELRGRIRTIALAPVRVDPEIEDEAPTRAQIEPLAFADLSAGGFAVVDANEMDNLWRAAAADVGSVFDPITGKIDRSRFEIVEDAAYRELASRHHVDAVLYLTLHAVEVFLAGPSVQFCCVTTTPTGRGGSGSSSRRRSSAPPVSAPRSTTWRSGCSARSRAASRRSRRMPARPGRRGRDPAACRTGVRHALDKAVGALAGTASR